MRKQLAVLLSAAVGVGAIATAAQASPAASQASTANIVGVAAGNKSFTTLVSLVKKAGLVSTLAEGGPFTVFAPTNQAFANLEKKNPALFKQVTSSKKLLQAVLTYHVIGKRIPAASAIAAAQKNATLKMVQGERAALSFKSGRIVINGSARVILPDINASNGIIHAINAVIVPPSLVKKPVPPPTKSVVEIAAGGSQFSTLVSLLQQAKLVETLSGTGPFTVFAPTNEAFDKLQASAPDTFKAVTSDPALLAKVLTYHVVAGDIMSKQAIAVAQQNGSVTSVANEPIALSIVNGKLTLNGSSTVTTADVDATNGVVHVIDTVIVPPSLAG
jgi:uncharacterized surface protein with fasciclin (FAS1) repeats